MTSDINGTVIAIQGNAISSAAPTDGYVLTWDATDGYWVARLSAKSTSLQSSYFTSSGTWTCPSGITSVLLVGCGAGGGGGGACNGSNTGGNGGNGGSGYLYIIYVA